MNCTVCGKYIADDEFRNEDFKLTTVENGVRSTYIAKYICISCSKKIFVEQK